MLIIKIIFGLLVFYTGFKIIFYVFPYVTQQGGYDLDLIGKKVLRCYLILFIYLVVYAIIRFIFA